MIKKIFLSLFLPLLLLSGGGVALAVNSSVTTSEDTSATIAYLLNRLEELGKQLDTLMQKLELKTKCYSTDSLSNAEIKDCQKQFKGFTYNSNTRSNNSGRGSSSGSQAEDKQNNSGLNNVLKQLDKLFGNGQSGSGLRSLLSQGGGCSGGTSGACGASGSSGSLLGSNLGSGFSGKPTDVVKCNCNENKATKDSPSDSTRAGEEVKANNKGLSIYLAVGAKKLIFDKDQSLGPMKLATGASAEFDTDRIITAKNVLGNYDSGKTLECKYTEAGQKSGDRTDCDNQEKVKTKQGFMVEKMNINQKGFDLPTIVGTSWCGACKSLERQANVANGIANGSIQVLDAENSADQAKIRAAGIDPNTITSYPTVFDRGSIQPDNWSVLVS